VLTILFVSFLVLLLLGIPIAFAMGASAAIAMLSAPSLLVMVPQKTFTALDSFSLSAVPLFIFAGEVMNRTGITRRIVAFANALVGHLRGGLCHASAVAGMIFAGVSGSATADAAAIATTTVPEMEKEGYDRDVAVSVVATAGTIGPIIPPSITMVIYSAITGLSIGQLFLAGIIPGIMFGLSAMVVSYYFAWVRGYVPRGRFSLCNVARHAKDALLSLGAPMVILTGIVGGAFTHTEAGAIAAAYALFVGAVYRELSVRMLYDALLASGRNSAVILIIISLASAFGWVLASEQFPLVVQGFLIGLTENAHLMFLFIIFTLLVIGVFLEGLAAMAIMVPILTPVAASFGYDPVHFALVVLLCLAIGSLTPPVGIVLYTVCGVTGTPPGRVGWTIWVYVLGMLAVTLLIAFVPALATYLPSIFY